MQVASLEFIWGRVESDRVPRTLSDFGWHYPHEYELQRCDMAVTSNFALLPRDGGLDNQDDRFIDDLYSYMGLLARLHYLKDNPDKAEADIAAMPHLKQVLERMLKRKFTTISEEFKDVPTGIH